MNLKISAYKPKYSSKTEQMVPGVIPYEVDFFDEMLNIKNGKYKEIVNSVRSIEIKKDRDRFKIENLPEGNKPNNYGNYVGSMSNHDKIYQNIIDVLQNGASISTNSFEV